MKTKCRVVALAVLLATIFCQLNISNACAQELPAVNEEQHIASDKEDCSGLIELDFEEVREEDIGEDYVLLSSNGSVAQVGESFDISYSNSKNASTTNVIYAQLNEAEKSLWDGLEGVCEQVLACSDYVVDPSNPKYNPLSIKTDYVIQAGISLEDGWKAVSLFRYCHPQYFFLNTTIGWAKYKSGKYGFSLGIYRVFNDPSARLTAKNQIDASVSTILTEASMKESAELKAKAAHDALCNLVTYNYAFENTADEDKKEADETQFTQSIYSVFVLQNTVCAGYAQAFQLVCAKMGISTISITSSAHQWNLINLDGNWYHADLTWDDLWSGCYYEYYLRSDEYFEEIGGNTLLMHTPESKWNSLLPECNRDAFYPNGYYEYYGIHAKYYVKYDGNGATSGKMKNSTMEFYEEEQLRTNKFVKAGYTFAGWNTKADGTGTDYLMDSLVVNLATNPDETIVLYAKWGVDDAEVINNPIQTVEETADATETAGQISDSTKTETMPNKVTSEINADDDIIEEGEIDDGLKVDDDSEGEKTRSDSTQIEDDNANISIWGKITNAISKFFRWIVSIIKKIIH